ncbi:hypothetical protein J6590_035644 [Homalodisca vitripennis]|nr:hypothetical protein J6590_035644 [Homalodisca vitripennis]
MRDGHKFLKYRGNGQTPTHRAELADLGIWLVNVCEFGITFVTGPVSRNSVCVCRACASGSDKAKREIEPGQVQGLVVSLPSRRFTTLEAF